MNRYVLVALTALALVATGCGRDSTEVNEIGLVYEGGVTQEKEYRGVLPAGSTWESVGIGSTVYRYRTDQRTYRACTEGGCDTTPVEVVTSDDVRMLVEYDLYFTLNLAEDTLRAFHENIGVKEEAWTPEGWVAMLTNYFEPQIERALENAALGYTARELYGDADARSAYARETVGTARTYVREVVGGDYFCGPAYQGEGSECGDFTFAVGRPTIVNADFVEAIEAEQANAARVAAQEQENLRIRAELDAERDLVELYGPEGALIRQAIANGQVQLMVIPPGTPVSVPPSATEEE